MKKYVCERCSGEVNDIQKFCQHCGSRFDISSKSDSTMKGKEIACSDEEGYLAPTELEVGTDYYVSDVDEEGNISGEPVLVTVLSVEAVNEGIEVGIMYEDGEEDTLFFEDPELKVFSLPSVE